MLTRIVFWGLSDKFDRFGWCFSFDDYTFLGFSGLFNLILGPFSFLLSDLFGWINSFLPSMASRYYLPKVRSVMAKLSIMMLNWAALSERSCLILSDTWSLWLNSWAAENWATTVLKISLHKAGNTFCS